MSNTIKNIKGGNRKNKDEIHYYFIYMHINKINNKKYVGVTYQNPPMKRWKNGKSYTQKSNPHLYYAIKKYGWENFEHIILEEGYFTVKEVGIKEDYYINFYNTRDTNFGYNVNAGGYKDISPNAEKAAVKWMKEHPEFGLARVAEMHKWQNEHKEEMYAMRKINSAKATEARKIKVVCVETGIVYESANEASRQTEKATQSKITMCCQGLRRTAGGYHWLYLDDYMKINNVEEYLYNRKKDESQRSTTKSHPVICVETGEYFSSLSEASRVKKLDRSSIATCCLNNNTCGGYHWRYVNE